MGLRHATLGQPGWFWLLALVTFALVVFMVIWDELARLDELAATEDHLTQRDLGRCPVECQACLDLAHIEATRSQRAAKQAVR